MIIFSIFTLLFIPIVKSSYYTHFILDESRHLCEEIHSRPLKFGDGIESAIRLDLYSKKPFHCQFEVFPRSEKHGIVVVIQEMKFRQNSKSGECVDYIMFKGIKFGKSSKKYCGNFDVESAMERYVYEGTAYIAMATQNAYQNHLDDGVLVIIHMNMNDDGYYDSGAELVLTSYTNCHSDAPWFYKPCIDKNIDTICIEDVYFTDGYVNCPFKGCVDEDTCVPLIVKFYGKRVFVGAIIGIVLSICLSAGCFLFCTPYRERGNQNDLPPNYMFPPIDDETDSGGSNEGRRGLEEERSKESEEEESDWDKPPLYESLFPNGQSSSFVQA